MAFAESPRVLHARLLDGAKRPLAGGQARWAFRDELPLRAVSDDLAALLGPFADIDHSAELSFGGGAERWSVSPFEASLTLDGRTLGNLAGIPHGEAAAVFGRPLAEAASERPLATVTVSERSERRMPALPGDIVGPWLIYLRRGHDVISRPRLAPFASGPGRAAQGLAGATAIAAKPEREAAILSVLNELAAGAAGSHADVRAIVALCGSLRSLPPASLDVLRLLARRPGAAARVALAAGDDARAAVLALSDALPFAWCMVPRMCWAQAAEAERQSTELTYAAVLGAAAAGAAREVVSATALKLVAAEPLLHWPLFAADLIPSHGTASCSLREAAMDHIRRHGDRVDEGGSTGSLFRSHPTHRLPLILERDFHPVHLDAPCPAAEVAAGAPAPNDVAIRRIKIAARADPIYFAEAFNARFLELMRS